MQQRKQLFQYAILYHAPKTKDAQGNDTSGADEVVVPITAVLAPTDNEVSIIAARQIPEKYLDKLDCIEVVVSPFNRP